ncbi:MAG TPA: DUF2905 domain-containing protein [Candidatus Dormibacteraeota bacterium]|nr:DUF2905 domain-containing protein [Candidatus Dormibacteraeota bacterium]
MGDIGKLLLIVGLALALAGAILVVGARLGLGRLPGDIAVSRGNVSIAFPIVTCLVISVILTVVINVVLRLRG